MRKFLIIRISIPILIFFAISCGALILRDVNCYDISGDLKLFPGNVQDSLVLSDRKGKKTILRIIKKIAKHISGYTTDTGCSCYDYWRVEISGSDVSIVFATDLQYIESTEGTRFEDLDFTTSNGSYTFTEANKKILQSVAFDGITIQNVIEYRRIASNSAEFSVVYLAKNIGILRLISGNGDTLTNANLLPNMNSGTETWDYTENVCE